MSITATTALDSATATSGQKRTATVTITNASSSSVTVTWVKPKAVATGTQRRSLGVLLGECTAGNQGFTVTVAGSNGTATVQFDIMPLAPPSGVYASNPFPAGVTPAVPLAQPAQQVLDIGAYVRVSDGSEVDATTTTLTVNGPTR